MLAGSIAEPPADPAYSEDGIDLTLIRWMLSLTPGQRLAVLQDQVDSLLTLRAKFNASFKSPISGNSEGPDAPSR